MEPIESYLSRVSDWVSAFKLSWMLTDRFGVGSISGQRRINAINPITMMPIVNAIQSNIENFSLLKVFTLHLSRTLVTESGAEPD